jgi:hypothetical protein
MHLMQFASPDIRAENKSRFQPSLVLLLLQWEDKATLALNGRGTVRQPTSSGRLGLWELRVKHPIRWTLSLFAWTVVKRDEAWIYFENRVTGQRRCRWNGKVVARADYSFMRTGDIVDGPFGHETLDTSRVHWLIP